MAEASDISANIIATRVIYSHQPHAVYDIEVRVRKARWVVSRRFKSFAQLHKELAGLSNVPELPPKTFFPNLSADFLKERRKALQAFLDVVVGYVTTTEALQKFLGIDSSIVLRPPEPHLSDFNVLSLIGKGAYGTVFQVQKKDTGNIYAMKVLKKALLVKNNEVDHALNERNILADVKSPFVVRLRFAFQTSDKLFLIQDYCSGGCLYYHLQNSFIDKYFPEDVARFTLAETMLALEQLHEKGILYRDLKPENVLLDKSGHIMLTDFGLSKSQMFQDVTRTACGTAQYLAPEMIKCFSSTAHSGYTKAIDWWSYGVLAFQLMTGELPFTGTNAPLVYSAILSGKDKIVFPQHLSQSARSLVSLLLESNVEKRMGNVKNLRKHPFFYGIDWDSLLRKTTKPPFVPETGESNESLNNVHEQYRNTRLPAKWFNLCAGEAVANEIFPNWMYSCEWFDKEEGGHSSITDSDDSSSVGDIRSRMDRAVTSDEDEIMLSRRARFTNYSSTVSEV